ncbi:hypothetical protein J2W35_004958 [Variovorax boronicumulans]|uniref:hypothetical protein n=1 Tax=Variovorax boronicumulans TaxID=436515 RepID=UPI00277EA2D5|nr:hypothetical protein [Variovorax boronicumulans]MDQ0084589.1 hypothetical protein [Variovorax boronicumulans]
MNANFFEAAPDPASNPAAFQQQQAMAQALLRRGGTQQQGQMVNGHYIQPADAAYAGQLVNALAGGYKRDQLRDADRASNLLNGGNGDVTPMQKAGTWLGGLFGGGGA